MNELALLPNTIVVPDSVEPYIGYKWLQIGNDNQLYSFCDHPNHYWLPGHPLEAQCLADFGWHWTVAPTHEAQQIRKGTDVVYDDKSRRLINTRIWLVNDTRLAEKPPKKPKLLLPPGLAWSYEPFPCPHDPVAEDCSCGIYAAKDSKTAAGYRRSQAMLVRVALWGRVIIGDKGARGQYAYPQEVLDTTGHPGLMEKVGEAYGIPFPGKYATPSIPATTEIKLNDVGHVRTVTPTKKKKKKKGVWRSPGLFNPGHTDWLGLSCSLTLVAVAVMLIGVAVFLLSSPWTTQDGPPVEIASVLGLIFAGLGAGLVYLAGDMFCEACGRKGWL